jgi:hypothetical protein
MEELVLLARGEAINNRAARATWERNRLVFERHERLSDVSLTSSQKTPGEQIVSPAFDLSLTFSGDQVLDLSRPDRDDFCR